MPPRLRKATLHGALFKLVKTRLCREWVRNLFGRRSGKLPRFYAWGRRIQPSSLALSLATPHARSRNSTGVIGASSSSPILCEALISAVGQPSERHIVLCSRQADHDLAILHFKF